MTIAIMNKYKNVKGGINNNNSGEKSKTTENNLLPFSLGLRQASGDVSHFVSIKYWTIDARKTLFTKRLKSVG